MKHFQVFENLVARDGNGILIPTAVDRCTLALNERKGPANLNPESDLVNSRILQPEKETVIASSSGQLHADAHDHKTSNNDPFPFRIVDHSLHADGSVTYTV